MEKKHPLSGKKQTPEQVQKRMEAVARNRATWSEEKIAAWKEKISKGSKAGTPEARRKSSIAHMGQPAWNKGRKCPEWSGENHWNFGKKMPEYVKAAIAKVTVGRKHTDEEKAKVSAKLKGRARPEEVKQKIRETSIKVWNTPEMKARSTGPNNATWKGGISFGEYGPECTKELRNRVKERDGHKCQWCDKPDNGKNLITHHIDHKKSNNDENNFVTICRSCHGTIHHRGKKRPEETCQRIRLSKSNISDETRRRISEAKKGCVISEEQRQKISLSLREFHQQRKLVGESQLSPLQ